MVHQADTRLGAVPDRATGCVLQPIQPQELQRPDLFAERCFGWSGRLSEWDHQGKPGSKLDRLGIGRLLTGRTSVDGVRHQGQLLNVNPSFAGRQKRRRALLFASFLLNPSAPCPLWQPKSSISGASCVIPARLDAYARMRDKSASPINKWRGPPQ